jgi:hypothetical protein
LKETLGGELGVTDREGSHRLGRAVFELMRVLVHELVANGVSLIVEGNFTRETRVFDALPPCRIVQVHVTASSEVLGARMLDRDEERHPVHYDREVMNEVARRAEAGEWDPLLLHGPLVRLDTTDGFEFDVAELVQQALAAAG